MTSSILTWLSEQEDYPKVFWKEREGNYTLAAFGEQMRYDSLPSLSSSSARVYGGFAFSSKSSEPLWKEFSSGFFFLPKIEIIQEGDRTKKIYPSLNGQSEEEEFTIPSNPSEGKNLVFKYLTRKDSPSFNEWKKKVEESLRLIEKKKIQKIVLARRTTFICPDLLNPLELLKSINPLSQRATCFAFVLSKHKGFIGVSPEKLFQRTNNTLFSEAIAGTRSRGSNVEADLQLEEELKESTKENREFKFVKEYILSTLSPLCESLQKNTEETVIKTKHVQHLYQAFEGILHPHVSDFTLIQSLHPTPAVGGFPTQQALKVIENKEPFDRGWYAAPVGWSSKEKAEFVVGIRSALIEGNQLHVFAGTGIVEGSQPEKEWEELEMKISTFKHLFV